VRGGDGVSEQIQITCAKCDGYNYIDITDLDSATLNKEDDGCISFEIIESCTNDPTGEDECGNEITITIYYGETGVDISQEGE